MMKLAHIFLAIVVAAIWGLNFVVIKLGLEDFPPLLFSCLRFLLSAIPAIFFLRMPEAKWRYLLLIGLVLGVIKFSFLFEGISFGMSAGLSSLVLQAQVFFSVIWAVIFFKERFVLNNIIGIICGLIGLVIIVYDLNSNSTLTGFIFTILAAIAWSISNILMRKMGRVKMLNFMVWMSIIPIIPLFILSYKIEGAMIILNSIQHIQPMGIFALGYVSFLATVFGYGAWGWLLGHYPVGTVAPFALLVPVFGIIAANLIFHEELSLAKILAISFIFMGLLINTFGAKLVRWIK